MIRTVILAALCAVLLASNADARPKHGLQYRSLAIISDHHRHHESATSAFFAQVGCSDQVMRPCGGALNFEGSYQRTGLTHDFVQIRENPVIKRMGKGLRRVMAEGAGRVVGGRPAGCPRRYCGCGASLYLFGKIIPKLNLAANWFRFPRTSPAPGMVAVRRHHVFVLKRHIRGKIWVVHDSNSGRGKTRVHPRSIAGWTIVDPRGA
jgi:hypothetical protein